MIKRQGTRRRDPKRLTVVHEPTSEVVGDASGELVEQQDALLDVQDGLSVHDAARVSVVLDSDVAATQDLTFRSSNEKIATVSSSGGVTGHRDGRVFVWVSDASGDARGVSEVFEVSRSRQSDSQFAGWVSGSLAHHMQTTIDAAIAAGDPTQVIPMLASPTTRNPQCWLAALADLSCIDAERPNATFIGNSGGHAWGLQAEHFVDGSDTFIDMAGNVVALTVDASRNIGPANSEDGFDTDTRLVRYSQELPGSFVPALLPPENIAALLPNAEFGVSAIVTDQEKKALTADLVGVSGTTSFRTPTDPRRLAFNETVISGDSGSGAYLLAPAEGSHPYRLVYLTGWTFGGAGRGPAVAEYLDLIFGAIEDLGGDRGDFQQMDATIWPQLVDGVWTQPEGAAPAPEPVVRLLAASNVAGTTSYALTLPPSPTRRLVVTSHSRTAGSTGARVAPTASVDGTPLAVASESSNSSTTTLTVNAAISTAAIPDGDSVDVTRISGPGAEAWQGWIVYEVDGIGDLMDTASGTTELLALDVAAGGLVFGAHTNPEGDAGFARDGEWSGLENEDRRLTASNADTYSAAWTVAEADGPTQISRTSDRPEFATTAIASFAAI